MSVEDKENPQTNRFRPGSVPGPPAVPGIRRPGALATPVQQGIAPAQPLGQGIPATREPDRRPEVVSTAVDPPMVSAFRPKVPVEPAMKEEVRPGIKPSGATLIAPPWKQRASDVPETAGDTEGRSISSPAPLPSVTARAEPREAGIRARQLQPGPWPWSGEGVSSAAVADEPWKAADRELNSTGNSAYSRPGRPFPWRAWALFALVWAGMFWAVLEREERLDRAEAIRQDRALNDSLHALPSADEIPSHIGVENAREVKLKP